jgi:hypothetical protein
MLAAALAAAGWLAGLVLTSHALLREIRSTYHSLGLDRFIGRVKQVEPVAAG